MFRPGPDVVYCPICGAPLEYTAIDQFGVPVGYSVQCTACCRYSDIWVNGLREVQCGSWFSPDYESDYGAMDRKEKWQASYVEAMLNIRLLWEQVKHKITQLRQPRIKGKQATA